MRCTSFLLLTVAMLIGCAKKPSAGPSTANDSTPPFQPKRILRDLTEKERFEILEQTMKEYHRVMGSSKREDWISGLKALLPEKSDFEMAFIKDADDIFKLSENVLYSRLIENIEKYAQTESRFGPLSEIKIRDARKEKDLSQKKKEDLAIIAPEVTVVEISRFFPRGESGGTYLMFVDGRWVFIPELGDIRDSLETWRKKK
jgi:hypothetical protein